MRTTTPARLAAVILASQRAAAPTFHIYAESSMSTQGREFTDETRRPDEDDASASQIDYGAARAAQAQNLPAQSGMSVVPTWISHLPLQQQSVLLLAARGPDGAGKMHRCKKLVRVYRATVFRAARHGRLICSAPAYGEGDTFMDRRPLRDAGAWRDIVGEFVESMEELPHHYCTHFAHGCEILGYKHPHPVERGSWQLAYYAMVEGMHLQPESEATMDARLCDWHRRDWYRRERPDEELAYGYGSVPAAPQPEACALARIKEIIEQVDHRAMAADGPVTPTFKEITDAELRKIYALASGHVEDWRPE